ncbi:MAG: hypothetical protein ABIK56_01410 [candidate division WOR-3 bacterium]
MEHLKRVISKFEYENTKKEFCRYLAVLYRQMRRKERIVFRHIGYRNMAEDGFCYEFYKNIAFWTEVHRNTIPKYVNFFIENKLLERKVLKAKYRYRKGLVLTKLGLCFYIFINKLNEYLSNKFKENNNYREIDFFSFIYNFLLNIFYLFYNILGSMHNGMHKVENTSNSEGSNGEVLGINLGIKEVKKPPGSDKKDLKELKRQQFIKILQAGYLLPESIMDEYNLWELKKSIT